MKSKTIFYDVDTQKDFMNSNGALYVPGAEDIKQKIAEVTNYATERGYRILGSVDRHFKDDPELQRNGGPFPDHCMNGTTGQMNILDLDPIFIESKIDSGNKFRSYSEREIENIVNSTSNIIFEKQHYDVFTNPTAEKILTKMDVQTVVLYGVATDYCNKAAALGMVQRGIEVYVVSDAIKAVAPETEAKAIDEMNTAGVKFIEFSELENVLGGEA